MRTAEDIKAMSVVDVVMELEGGDLEDEICDTDGHDVAFYQAILDKVSALRYSQGYYSRLCNTLEEIINMLAAE